MPQRSFAELLLYAAYCERQYLTSYTSVKQYRVWLDRVIVSLEELLTQPNLHPQIATLADVVLECKAIRDLTHSTPTPYQPPSDLLERDGRGILYRLQEMIEEWRKQTVSEQEHPLPFAA